MSVEVEAAVEIPADIAADTATDRRAVSGSADGSAPLGRLALFDFDGTLTTRDSFMPFLRHSVGTLRFAVGLLRCSGPLLGYLSGRIDNGVAKQQVITHFLGGRCIDEVRRFGDRFARERLPRLIRPDVLAALQRHRDAGDVCVLVSASLGVYLDGWARQHGFAAVLCSQLETDGGGRVTGRIAPRNCFGAEKARRIRQWLAGRTPQHITAYGDSRGDREMMALADTAHWLRGTRDAAHGLRGGRQVPR